MRCVSEPISTCSLFSGIIFAPSFNVVALSNINVPLIVVALPSAPTSTAPPPNVVFPVVVANTLAESVVVVAIIS